jgi:hypothetical protein
MFALFPILATLTNAPVPLVQPPYQQCAKAPIAITSNGAVLKFKTIKIASLPFQLISLTAVLRLMAHNPPFAPSTPLPRILIATAKIAIE